MSFDIAGALESIAPTLSTMLLGPLAGTAVSALESAFGLTPGSGADGITKVMQSGNMTPDIIASVRAQDQKHAEVIAQSGVDLAKLNADHEVAMNKLSVDSADSARHREEVIKDNTPAILAYILIGGFLVVSVAQLVALMLFPVQSTAIPPQGWLLIGNISGYLAFEAKQAATYYFGSTVQSKAKDDTINKAVTAAQ